MNENRSHFTLYNKPPFLQFATALLISIVGGGAVFLFMFLIGLLFTGIDLNTLSENFMADIGVKNINFFRYLMIIQSISIMIIPAIMIRRMLLPDKQNSLNDFGLPKFNETAIVVLLAFCILPISGIAGELNSNMKFPEWLSGLEGWMRSKEDEAAVLTGLLIPSGSAGILFLNLFIVAALPAISEELFFRGVFQRIFYGFFKSPHSAIWFTSILFSAIHLQFYGFIPRLILGLSFGYLYFWGRTLWLPVIAHFVNNAVVVTAEYVHIWDSYSTVTEGPLWIRLLILPTPVIISAVVLLYFRNKFSQEQKPIAEFVATDNQDHL
jgi:membrane protease YdiL (CAAX protease family)